jgi:hypothetical protein
VISPSRLQAVIREALETIGLYSLAAEQLLMGTAAQESNLIHLRQLGSGPALGYFQMEPATHEDIWISFLRFRPELRLKVCALVQFGALGQEGLVLNPHYAAGMARVHYLRDKQPLPLAGDVAGMARTWKRVFNTEKGAGTEAEFIHNWRLVAPLYQKAA